MRLVKIPGVFGTWNENNQKEGEEKKGIMDNCSNFNQKQC